MNLSDWSIRRPVFAWMLMSALIVFGAISFLRLGVSQLPDVDFPYVSVSIDYQGASPEVVETQIIDPTENALLGIPGIRSLSSSSRAGSGSVSIEFELDRSIDDAVFEVQSRIGQVMRSLPDGVEPPIVSKSNPEDQPILWLSLKSDRHKQAELMAFVRDTLRESFVRLPGVSDVFLAGYADPSVRVWVSRNKLQSYALTIQDIIQAIRTESSDLPAGKIENADQETQVHTAGEISRGMDFSKVKILQRGGSPIFSPLRVGDVARVESDFVELTRLSRTDGQPAVGFGIRKIRGANSVSVADGVFKKIQFWKSQLPKGMDLQLTFDSTQFIRESIHELLFNLLISAILTALVCWLFLGTWTSALNVILAIPTSVVGTFTILYFSGFTLNTFTLLALSLSIGIVVDDAIMVLENIVRKGEEGLDRVEAARVGASEIYFAAMASTLSIVAIFLPVAFMKGLIGKFFFQFGVTLSAAVMLSLVEALTLTPMRCAQFVHSGKKGRLEKWVGALFSKMEEGYKRLLFFTSEKWIFTLLAAALFTGFGFWLLGRIPKEMMPAQDQGRLMVRMQTPLGSSLQHTEGLVKNVEQYLATRKEIERTFISVGGFGGGDSNSAMGFLTLKPKKERQETLPELIQLYRKDLAKIKGIKVQVQDPSQRGFSRSRGFPVEFSVRGPEWKELSQWTQKLLDLVEKQNLLTDVDMDYKPGLPEVVVTPDRQKAFDRGVSIQAVGQVVQASVGGVVAGYYTEGGRRKEVRVRLEGDERNGPDDIKKIDVRNNRGELVSLGDLVSVSEKMSMQSIARQDRERAISVYANLKPGVAQAEAVEKIQQLAQGLLPDGYRVVLGGSSESMKETFSSLIFALVLGIVIAYMILASQFNSFFHPVTVLLALPLSFTGAFLGLWLLGQSINLYSMIGFVLLMGIVKKNSILLVDFSLQVFREKGISWKEAVFEACPKRLRPIVMTSLTTVVGACPLAFSLGTGSEVLIPMAVAIMGGVVFSTALTLLVIPAWMVATFRIWGWKHRG